MYVTVWFIALAVILLSALGFVFWRMARWAANDWKRTLVGIAVTFVLTTIIGTVIWLMMVVVAGWRQRRRDRAEGEAARRATLDRVEVDTA